MIMLQSRGDWGGAGAVGLANKANLSGLGAPGRPGVRRLALRGFWLGSEILFLYEGSHLFIFSL
jgi:hypothetical protein